MAKVISVSDLKENLSRYLRQVQRGDEIQVVSHGRPVARLIGLAGAAVNTDERQARLVAAGVMTAGSGDALHCLSEPPLVLAGAELSRSLDDERADRV